MAKNALVILLHGIGGSGSSLSPISSVWRPYMTYAAFHAPDAPFPYDFGPGHQWFGVDGQELRPDRIKSVRDGFDEVVMATIERAGFVDRLNRVAFVGVSQGAIVALDAVASGRWKVGALVSIAGLLPPIPISSTAKSIPMCLIHGELDQTIPPTEATKAAARLAGAGVKVESHVVPAVAHTVSTEELNIARAFLLNAIPPL